MDRIAIISLILLSYTGISVGMIGKALLTPYHLFMGLLIGYGMFIAKKERSTVMVSLILLLIHVLIVNGMNFPNIRYTSILYTLIYGIEFTILYNLMRRTRIDQILYAFRIIVFSYMGNLFLANVFDAVGFHNPIVSEWIRIHHNENDPVGRPMGFSTEPSYAAFILSVTFLCYNHLNHHKWDKTVMKLAGAYFFCIILTKSAYGFIFVAVNMMDWFFYINSRASKALKQLIPFIAVIIVMAGSVAMQNSENETAERLTKVSEVLSDPSYDAKKKMQKLQEADGSAFARIGPTYLLFNAGDEIEVNFLIGAGAGSAGDFLAKFLDGVTTDDATKVDTGIIPAFVFDYGIIGFVLLWIFLINCFNNLSFPFWIMFILVLPNANINTQLLWYGISCYTYVSVTKAAWARETESLNL